MYGVGTSLLVTLTISSIPSRWAWMLQRTKSGVRQGGFPSVFYVRSLLLGLALTFSWSVIFPSPLSSVGNVLEVSMATFMESVQHVLENEKYIADHSKDRGGLTVWGISSKIFPREVKKMLQMSQEDSRKFATKIYREKYWKKLGLDSVDDQEVATKLLDMGVHNGVHTVGRMLQKSLNELGASIEVDGQVGPQTLEALHSTGLKSPDALLNSLKSKQIRRYKEIIEENPSQKVFQAGWLKRASATPEIESAAYAEPRKPKQKFREDEAIGPDNETMNFTDFEYLLKSVKPEQSGRIKEIDPAQTDFNKLLKKAQKKDV